MAVREFVAKVVQQLLLGSGGLVSQPPTQFHTVRHDGLSRLLPRPTELQVPALRQEFAPRQPLPQGVVACWPLFEHPKAAKETMRGY